MMLINSLVSPTEKVVSAASDMVADVMLLCGKSGRMCLMMDDQRDRCC